MTALATVNILGVTIHCVDFAQTLALVERWIDSSAIHSALRDGPLGAHSPLPTPHSPCRQVCTVNPEFIIDARRDGAFAGVLRRADLCVADGIGVLLAARLNGVRLAERVTGSDGIYRLCAQAATHGWRVYFLGAAPGVAERTAALLQLRYPGLAVAGAASGSPADADWPALYQRLEAVRPDLLFVAFGHPRQDFWIDRHRHELPAKIALGVGGAFDFVAGVRTRAPRWMQRLGLEWLYRLLREPQRWRRMLKLPQFAWLVFAQRIAPLPSAPRKEL